mmetsp:Transcript_32253/g.88967  ORF Transcript_32253/g.88967 Transcript_32253/m.88967 type:complete len:375 (+) Transcript_32253:410-1534(+)
MDPVADVAVQQVEEAHSLPRVHVYGPEVTCEGGVAKRIFEPLGADVAVIVRVRQQGLANLVHRGVLLRDVFLHLRLVVLQGDASEALDEDRRCYVQQAPHDEGDVEHDEHDGDGGDPKQGLHQPAPWHPPGDGHEECQHGAPQRAVAGEELRVRGRRAWPILEADSDGLQDSHGTEEDDGAHEQHDPGERSHGRGDGVHQEPERSHVRDVHQDPGGTQQPREPNGPRDSNGPHEANVVHVDENIRDLNEDDHGVERVPQHVGVPEEAAAVQAQAGYQLNEENERKGHLDRTDPLGHTFTRLDSSYPHFSLHPHPDAVQHDHNWRDLLQPSLPVAQAAVRFTAQALRSQSAVPALHSLRGHKGIQVYRHLRRLCP